MTLTRHQHGAAAQAAAPQGGRPRRRRGAGAGAGRRPWLGLLYAAPGLILYALVVITPVGQGVWLSFFHWNGVTAATWAGFSNYTGFLSDPTLRAAVEHTLIFFCFYSLPPIALGLFSAALTSYKGVRGAGAFRAVGDFTWALPALGIAGTWASFGLCMLMFVSSMQSIPQELYDAVRVDGAGAVREFFTVTLPNLRGPGLWQHGHSRPAAPLGRRCRRPYLQGEASGSIHDTTSLSGASVASRDHDREGFLILPR